MRTLEASELSSHPSATDYTTFSSRRGLSATQTGEHCQTGWRAVCIEFGAIELRPENGSLNGTVSEMNSVLSRRRVAMTDKTPLN
jgi:hypothetical protein